MTEMASPQQYQWLLGMMEKAGVMPADFGELCRLRYGRPFYALSYDDATHLLNELLAVGQDQGRVRAYISRSVTDLLVEPMQA